MKNMNKILYIVAGIIFLVIGVFQREITDKLYNIVLGVLFLSFAFKPKDKNSTKEKFFFAVQVALLVLIAGVFVYKLFLA